MKRSTFTFTVFVATAALASAACAGSDDAADDPRDTATPQDGGATTTMDPIPNSSPVRTSPPTSMTTAAPPRPTATAVTEPETAPPGSVGGADGIDVDEGALQAILDEWRTEVNTFGATLSIRLPGRADIHLASGVDDREINALAHDGSPIEHAETPMPTDGTHPIGYVTRSFVAAAALQLVADGRLTLDQPVQRWLPELPAADQTTLRMLLGYTSGLGQWDDADQATALLADLSRSYTPEEVLAKHLEQPPTGPPGGNPAFGRAGYIAAGLLIERVLEQDLATIIQERFIEPLALDDTVFSNGSTLPTRHGWFAAPGGGGDRATDYLDVPQQAAMTNLWASEAIISTTTDVLDWSQALFSGQVLGPETTATMLEMNPVSPPPVPNRYYGLGATGYCLETGCNPDEAEIVGTPGGGFCCWSTQLAYHRASGTIIFVHANTNDPTPAALIQLPLRVLHQLRLT